MPGKTGTVILIIAAVAALGIWFGVLRQTPLPTPDPEVSAPATTAETPQAAENLAEDPEPAADPVMPQTDTPDDNAVAIDSPVGQPVDTSNWICGAWQDEAGTIVTTGTANNETCIQWTIRQGAASD